MNIEHKRISNPVFLTILTTRSHNFLTAVAIIFVMVFTFYFVFISIQTRGPYFFIPGRNRVTFVLFNNP